jgi:hypothetical protein
MNPQPSWRDLAIGRITSALIEYAEMHPAATLTRRSAAAGCPCTDTRLWKGEAFVIRFGAANASKSLAFSRLTAT